jgi:hypothetical protein
MAGKVPNHMGGNERLEEIEKFLGPFQFVILYHVTPDNSDRASHWDLLLEPPTSADALLLCFEVMTSPENWCSSEQVRRLADHRRIYLNYQGPISGGRGCVQQTAAGSIQWQQFGDSQLTAILTGNLADGQRFEGRLRLDRDTYEPLQVTGLWHLRFEKSD